MTADSRDPGERAAPSTVPPSSEAPRPTRRSRRNDRMTSSNRPTKASPATSSLESNSTAGTEFDIEPARRSQAVIDPPPTLAPETPMPRCLTQGTSPLDRHAAAASNIPRAPRLPNVSLSNSSADARERAQTQRRERSSSLPPVLTRSSSVDRQSVAARRPLPGDDDQPPSSESVLGLSTDRVLPGSPALVSTFRPKPELRSYYSVTRACQEERIFTPKRAVPAPRRRRKPQR